MDVSAHDGTDRRYTATAQLLHWVSAALMAAVVGIGWYMSDLPRQSPVREDWYDIHKAIGVTILAITILRILWRMVSPPPAEIAAHPIEMLAARLGHLILYLVLVGMPLSGYIHSVAGGHPVSVFGLFPLPTIVPVDKGVSHIAGVAHEVGQWIVYVMVALHILATLFHALVRKDGVALRMLPAFIKR